MVLRGKNYGFANERNPLALNDALGLTAQKSTFVKPQGLFLEKNS